MPDDRTPPLAPSASDDLIAAAAVGIISLDVDARITGANAAAEQLLGRSEKELIGLGAHEALNGDRALEDCELEAAVRDSRAIHVHEDTFQGAVEGALPVWWVVSPLRDPADATVLGALLVFGDGGEQRARAAADALERARGRADLAEAQQNVATAQQNIADLEWAAAASQAMTSTLDEDEVMHRLARLSAGRLAPYAFATLVTDGGARRGAHAVDDRVGVDLDVLLSRPDLAPDAEPGSATYRLLTTPDLRELDPSALTDPDVLSPRTQALMRELRATYVLIVPLVARGHVVGTLALIRSEGDAPFSDMARLAATDIALRAALAVDNARLFRAQADIASRLQHALLPALPEMTIRAAARYLPARDRFDVGGDWYDAFRLPNDTVALVVGDVAGHDLAAGTTMSALRNLLRGVNVVTDAQPDDVLRAVDESLEPLAIRGTATVLLAHVRAHGPGQWAIRWSNAGHMPPVFIGPGGEVEMLNEVHGSLLGTGHPQRRSASERIVPAGTTVILYTDGLVETREETIDAGLVRLRRSAMALTAALDDPDSIADELLARNHASVEDDTALLVCYLP